MEIYEILNKIQTELKVPKNLYNEFGKFKYRSCESILEAVKPILKDLNVSLIINDDLVSMGDRYYIKATARLAKNDKEFVESTAFAREALTKKSMDESQITGATSSYARKYALNGLFCIDDTKDADFYDNTESNQSIKNTKTTRTTKNTTTDTVTTVTDEEVAKIMSYCKKFNKDINTILSNYKIDNLKKLNKTQYNSLIKRFEELAKNN